MIEVDTKGIHILCYYAQEDKTLQNELLMHLSIFKRSGLIAKWVDCPTETQEEKKFNNAFLKEADIVFLLITPSFMTSSFYRSSELLYILWLHNIGRIQVIPIILKPVAWENSLISTLERLPPEGKAITSWSNIDEGFHNTAKALHTIVLKYLEKKRWLSEGGIQYNNEIQITDLKTSHRWPGEDDSTVVEEMLRDRESEHWFECREFVKKRVSRATNFPRIWREDIVQDAMIKIDRTLHTFQYQCTFSTWLFAIVQNCIIDVYRKFSRGPLFTPLLEELHRDSDHEGDAIVRKAAASTEDEFFVQEEMGKALLALQEYVVTHGKKRRNARILQMVLFENRSLEEAAREVGCSAPVAGYVVRAAQSYVRRKLRL